MRLKFRRRPPERVAAEVVVQVVGILDGFEVRVAVKPELDAGTVAAMLRRAASNVEKEAGLGG